MQLLEKIVRTLSEEKPLPPERHDHALHGNFEGFRECHIENDWLLMYTVNHEKLILTTSRTGSHSDLFG